MIAAFGDRPVSVGVNGANPAVLPEKQIPTCHRAAIAATTAPTIGQRGSPMMSSSRSDAERGVADAWSSSTIATYRLKLDARPDESSARTRSLGRRVRKEAMAAVIAGRAKATGRGQPRTSSDDLRRRPGRDRGWAPDSQKHRQRPHLDDRRLSQPRLLQGTFPHTRACVGRLARAATPRSKRRWVDGRSCRTRSGLLARRESDCPTSRRRSIAGRGARELEVDPPRPLRPGEERDFQFPP